MGVVVKQTKGNHYKTHRILMPDGPMFEFNKNEEATTGWMTDVPTGESQPITSSNEILSPNNGDVKRQNLATESSVAELYDGSVPDEELAERARAEAAEYLEAPYDAEEEAGRTAERFKKERDGFDTVLSGIDVSKLSDKEYLQSVSGNIVKAIN